MTNKKNFVERIQLLNNLRTSKKILLVDRERTDAIGINSILALAIAEKYKLKPFILTDKKIISDHINIYKKYGFKNLLVGISKFQYLRFPLFFLLSFLKSINAIKNIIKKGFLWFINNYKTNKILIGDLIYDTYIRFEHRYINPKVSFYLFKIIFISTFRTYIICEYLKKHKFEKIVIGTECYSFNSGIALRISIFKNIKNYTIIGYQEGQFRVCDYNKNHIQFGHDSIKKTDLLKRFYALKVSKKNILNFYEKRKIFKTKNFYTGSDFLTANVKKYDYLNSENKIKNFKGKKVLFALHSMSDSVHLLGLNFIFDDYCDQLRKTLEFVIKNDDKNLWIIRPHPASKIFNEMSNILEILKESKKNNIVICPKNLTVNELYKICDTVVTGRGTIGLEFASEGKNVITAGSSPYSKFGLCHEARSQKKYFNYLKNINNLKKLNKNNVFTAKKILYFFETGFFINKLINNKIINSDKILKHFIKKNLGTSLDRKKYLKSLDEIFNKDLSKSLIFKNLKKII